MKEQRRNKKQETKALLFYSKAKTFVPTRLDDTPCMKDAGSSHVMENPLGCMHTRQKNVNPNEPSCEHLFNRSFDFQNFQSTIKTSPPLHLIVNFYNPIEELSIVSPNVLLYFIKITI